MERTDAPFAADRFAERHLGPRAEEIAAMLATIGYRDHPLYQGNKDKFLTDYLADKLADEARILDYLTPAIESAPGKVWLLIVVSKQDLWWPCRGEVKSHYTTGAWEASVSRLQQRRGAAAFRSG